MQVLILGVTGAFGREVVCEEVDDVAHEALVELELRLLCEV